MKKQFHETSFKERAKHILLCSVLPMAWMVKKAMRVGNYLHMNRRKVLAGIFAVVMILSTLPVTSLTVSAETATPLTFTAEEADSGVTLSYLDGSDVMYKKNGGEWTAYSKGSSVPLENIGDTVSFKGTGVTTNRQNHFTMRGKIAASGDVTSLTNEVGGDAALTNYCYDSMFYSCKSLTTAPNLPAITMADYCYQSMFHSCTNLTTVPEVPATTLAESCYYNMFFGCTALTTLPKLPATTLPTACYAGMFNGCTGIMVSEIPTDDCTKAWSIPSTGTAIAENGWNIFLLLNTGGPFTGNPELNTTYYIYEEPTTPTITEQWDGVAATSFSGGGTGSTDDPYKIVTAAELKYFADIVSVQEYGASAILTADIDLNSKYTFTFDADTGLVVLEDNEGVQGYFGTGVKGDASGENAFFDETPSTKGTFYPSNDSNESGEVPTDLNTWAPICQSQGWYYKGTFNGNSKTVSGIYINNLEGYYVGLFGYTQDPASISNVTVGNSFICGSKYVGGVCGYSSTNTKISDCSSSAIVIGNDCVGGVCGYGCNNTTISNCSSSATVISNEDVGGVCGNIYNSSKINDCSSTATVIGNDYIGGVCGYLSKLSQINNCSNTSDITGNKNVGGVCGSLYVSSKLINCFNTGDITGNENVGGVCGYSKISRGNNFIEKNTITGCYNTGNVSSSGNCAGGLCGCNATSTISNCFNTGNIIGNSMVAGLCGFDEYTQAFSTYGMDVGSTFTNCYNTGTVKATKADYSYTYAGGICGCTGNYLKVKFTNCYNTGTIKTALTSDLSYAGGLLGYIVQKGEATINGCYYLTGCAAKDVAGVVINGTVIGAANQEDANQFSSGEVAYLLNGSKSEGTLSWYQTLSEGGDATPVLTSTGTNTVYYGYTNCLATEKTYANASLYAEIPEHTYNGWTFNDDGTHSHYCTICNTHLDRAEHTYIDDICIVCGAVRHDFTGAYDGYDVTYHWHICNIDGCTETDAKVAHSGGTATYFDKAVCDVCGQEYGTTTPDVTAPTNLKIQYNTNGFKSFLNTITFAVFFKETVNITASAEDSESGIASYQYLASDTEITDFTSVAWQNSLSLTPNSKKIVYVKAMDNAGNSSVVNYEGVVVYSDSSVSPVTATFDKNVDVQADIAFTMALNSNTLKDIKNGATTLTEGTDYTVNGNTVTVKKAYFAAQANGTVTLTFSFYPMGVENNDNLSTATAAVTVSDTTHYHSMSHTAYKVETCTVDGNNEYWYCSGCQKYFSDENGDTEITLESTVISKLGHSFTYYCSNGDATCTEDGTKTATCDRCSETDTIVDTGSALGHSFTHYASDENATCVEDGTKTATCDRCSETDTIPDTGSALGHSFTNYVSNNDATCTEDGTKTAYCDRAGCTEINTVADTGSALGHSFTNYVSDDNATCTEDGTKTATCDRCTETDTIADTGSALGHDFTGAYDGYDANYHWHICNRDGCDETDAKAAHTGGTADYFHKAVCTACGQEYGSTTPDVTAPTNLKIQYNNNGFKSFLNTITFGLFFKETVTVTASAEDSESGIASYQYLASDTEINDFTSVAWQDSLSLTPNSKKMIYVKAMDNAGNSSVVNYEGVVVYSDSSVSPVTATFDKNVDVQADIAFTMALNSNTLKDIKNGATALTDGTDYTVNGNTVTVKKTYFAAQANGTVTLTFSFYPMGVENNDNLSTATAAVTVSDTTHYHSMSHTTEAAATCTENGNTEYWYCSGCQKYFSDANGDTVITLESTVISKLGHSMTYTAKKDATCTADGNVEYWYCSTCEKYFGDANGNTELTNTVTAKLGHSFTNYVSDNNAVCTEDGTKTAKCDRCDETDTVADIGSALGHDFTGAFDGHDDTNHWHICNHENCQEMDLPVPHNWGDNVIEKRPTATEAGFFTCTCEDCGAERKTLIPPTAIRDIEPNSYYEEAVYWAISSQITYGTSSTTFSPNKTLSRAEMVTYIWRMAGSPEPESNVSIFHDVTNANLYYYKAVTWACEQKLVYGTDANTFSPDQICTREQIVTVLWRLAGSQNATINSTSFKDVDTGAYYYQALLWATENGIVGGTSNTTFSPKVYCTRAQMACFLFRLEG